MRFLERLAVCLPSILVGGIIVTTLLGVRPARGLSAWRTSAACSSGT